VPFWNFFGVQHVFSGQPDPTEAQIRWQVFTSLAFGAKGFMYFCYWGGILTQRHEWQRPNQTHLVLTRHYEEAKRINTDVLAWEKYLLAANSTGVWYVNETTPLPATSGCALATLNGVAFTNPSPGPTAGRLLLGQFEYEYTAGSPKQDNKAAGSHQGSRQDKRRQQAGTLLMIVNQDHSFNVNANLTFRPDAQTTTPYVCEISREHGAQVPVLQEATEHFEVGSNTDILREMSNKSGMSMELSREISNTNTESATSLGEVGLQLTIGAGDARLLLLSEQPCGNSRQ